jgi:uncharacterized Tic20 family protein
MEKTQIIQKKSEQDNSIKLLTHILGLITGFIGPLIILIAAKEEDVKEHAKRALNWQISLFIYSTISIILIFVFIGIFFLIVLLTLNLIFCIVAAVKANQGELWNYPITINFIK